MAPTETGVAAEKSALPPLPDGVTLRIYLQLRYSDDVVREATIETFSRDIRDAEVRGAVSDAIRTLTGKQGYIAPLPAREAAPTVESSVGFPGSADPIVPNIQA